MMIIDSRKKRTIKFEKIKCGEMFYDPRNEMFCLRIQECWRHNCEVFANAVDVADGELAFYDQDDDVTLVKGKVEIYE